jgi:hypothetical protein
MGIRMPQIDRKRMNRLLRGSLAICVVSVVGCSANHMQSGKQPFDGLTVSMIQIIASPEKYDGKKLMVDGHLEVWEVGGPLARAILFFDDRQARQMVLVNSINIEYDPEKVITELGAFDGKQVVVSGRFETLKLGHTAAMPPAGVLKDIEFVTLNESDLIDSEPTAND